MYDKLLDRLVDGDTVIEIDGSYLSNNHFRFIHQYFIKDSDQNISIHLWYKGNTYVMRITDCFVPNPKPIYLIKWIEDVDTMETVLYILRKYYTVDEKIKSLLDIILKNKKCFSVKYGLR